MGIKKSISKRPPRLICFGLPSVGKTTLASQAPSPVFICCEDGARELNVAAWVFDEKSERVQPKSLDEFRAAVKSISTSHDGYKTLVIDGIGDLDKLVQKHLCDQNPKWKGNIQFEGFGRPEAMILGVWRELIVDFEEANASGLGIILLGHSRVDKHSPPDSVPIDRYQMAVTSHKLGDVAGMLFGWADVVGFAKFQPMLIEEGKRTRGVGIQGARIMHLQRTDSYDAKCRYKNAPAQIPMSWTDLARVMEAPDLVESDIRAELELVIPQLPEEKQPIIRNWLSGQLTVDELAQGLDRARGMIIIKAA